MKLTNTNPLPHGVVRFALGFHRLPVRQQLHFDVAVSGFGVRANRVGLGHEFFGLLLVDAGDFGVE